MARTVFLRGQYYRFRDGRLIPIDSLMLGRRRRPRVLRKPSARV